MKTPALTCLISAALSFAVCANDWPSWRGPSGDGNLPDEVSYPVSWSEEENRLWRVAGLGDLSYSNVLIGGDKAVYLCGFGGPGIGIRLPTADRTGDLTEEVRLWADPPKGQNQNPQRIGSGQIVGDHVYLLNEPGVIQCLQVDTGESVWRERLSEKSWSSMNLVGGKLYVNEKNGSTYVIDPDPSGLKLVSTNSLAPNQHTNASLAFAGGRVYQRTDQHLYAFGQ